jgi:hypothetical protein
VSGSLTVDDDPLDRRRVSIDLSPYVVKLRSSRRPTDRAAPATELIESLAARLGVTITFDDLGYAAEFTIVALNDMDADSTARRRWFYLATDLELPAWPITRVAVTPLSRTDSTARW